MWDSLLPEAKILIVDDEEANVHLLVRILEQAGARHLATTQDPFKALPLYATVQPDLVILDLMMPGLDGFGVMTQIRARAAEEHYVPFLIVTADPSPETRLRALEAGASDFLTKPIDRLETVLRIGHLLEVSFLQRRLQERIARDLHDGPLQELGVLLLAVERCRRQVEAGTPEAALETLGGLRAALRQTIQQVRSAVVELRPPLLDSHGQRGALDVLAAPAREAPELAVQVAVQVAAPINPAQEALVFRLAQEALTNVRKHADARQAWIEVTEAGSELHLDVRDDGRGFVVQEALRQALASGHVGLAGLYERAKSGGGRLIIESQPGAGTTLHFVLPLRHSARTTGLADSA